MMVLYYASLETGVANYCYKGWEITYGTDSL